MQNVILKYWQYIAIGVVAALVALISYQGNSLFYPAPAPFGSQVFKINIKPAHVPSVEDAAKSWVATNTGVPSTTVAVATWHKAVAPALAAQKAGRLVVLNGSPKDVYIVFENFSRLGIKTFSVQ